VTPGDDDAAVRDRPSERLVDAIRDSNALEAAFGAALAEELDLIRCLEHEPAADVTDPLVHLAEERPAFEIGCDRVVSLSLATPSNHKKDWSVYLGSKVG
jgi:hypothetical protein